ncbi:MmgE/PrpD family protein [Actinomadura livida]|uniref:2-methylcitrate dehydratase PrpD n=1 Tax=Actinomadura livida TaxID=79909 RepID=A0A7W7I8B8_9ACTN|nr:MULTISPECIES: MmgE/PrpD family protein [Actinomadura]MBB4772320.1 2-methylcitrate dehydratase PrpD [Actinomadura catellatispora]GGU28517.1 hypothetical protein GCM10010208_61760 [Actinomadura livida]
MTTPSAPSYEEIAEAVLDTASRPLPEDVAAAARRTLFNVLAVALGAAESLQVIRLAAALAGSGIPAAPGVRGTASPADAALLTGFAGHLDDFDDTHLVTVIHPGASVLGAAWAAGWTADASGSDLLAAFALGCEVQLRLGLAVSPEHYDRGWHITGTCGVVGAAVTAALLGALDRGRISAALRLASLQTLGHREAFGTEVKPYHAGKAAAGGLLAAAEAARGRFTADAAAVLPDIGGLLRALAPGDRSPGRLLGGFGTRWELTDNTFKPYPCGIVAHPGIDAAVRAHERGVAAADVVRIRYRCHPLVPELMGRLDPRTGLQARFSAVHGVAAGLVRGTGGLAEFSDAAVADPALAGLRARVELCPEPRMPRDSAVLEIHTAGGGTVESVVEHARGSLLRPLTDEELIAKAEALAPGRAEPIWDAVTHLTRDDGPRTIQALLEESRRKAAAR